MKVSEECLKLADDCEREAAACGPGSSRDILLATAAQRRRLAEAAASEEVGWRLIAGKPMIQKQQVQQRHTQTPDETKAEN